MLTMRRLPCRPLVAAVLRRAGLLACLVAPAVTPAADFSVSPILVELRPGTMNETITVTNDAPTRLRVSMKLFAWTQDAAGQDVLADSADLIYFPRQMEVDPGARRLVRVGIKAPATGAERAYRLFIEEEPDPAQPQGRAQVAIYFRFGVPVFVAAPDAKAQPEVAQPTLARGRMSVRVRNAGNRHLRLTRVVFSDGAGFRQEQQGWYSLAGSERTYAVDIPADVCRKARTLQVLLEGENLRFERTLDVDAAACA